jgi:glycerol-3-phosphate acyltransferase PlsX
MKKITISVDAMSGDNGLDVVIPAAINVIKKHANLHLALVGDEQQIKSSLQKHNIADCPRLTTHNATQIVAMDETPTSALRYKKDSSMRVAINLVKEGKVQACVSAGNTGALMAMAHFVLKSLPGIKRPAIMSFRFRRQYLCNSGNVIPICSDGVSINFCSCWNPAA